MSKQLDSVIDQRSNQLISMSSRQQINFLKNKTNIHKDWTIEHESRDDPDDSEIIDYETYWEQNKKEIRNNISKNKIIERKAYLKQSQKEYTPIKKNIFVDRKKFQMSEDDAYICQCEKPIQRKRNNQVIPELSYGCYGKECLNQFISTECVGKLCPSGKLCRNRRFQLQHFSEVYPKRTEERGWGLFAGEYLPKGTFVMQYMGEIYSTDSDYGIEKLKNYKNKTCTYLMSLHKNEVIDPTFKGNLARFINHSCEPNCETQKWNVLGEVSVGIFTVKDIPEDEELSFNYGFDVLKTTFQRCLCRASNCRGFLGLVQSINGKIQTKINCDQCKNSIRSTEPLLICESCNKIVHKKCAISMKKAIISDTMFKCKKCVKGRLKKSSKALPLSKDEKELDVKQMKSQGMTFSDKDLIELSKVEAGKAKEVRNINDNYNKDKNESIDQNAISILVEKTKLDDNNTQKKTENEFQNEKSDKSEDEDDNYENENEDDNQMQVEVDEIKDQTSALEDSKLSINADNQEDTQKQGLLEVESFHIRIIKNKLKELSNFGARLFWDFRQQSSLTEQSKIEIKISGSNEQIEQVKRQIKYYIDSESSVSTIISLNLEVPKIFVRKIVGHQNRNQESLQTKFNVKIDYDNMLITDDIFPINESTTISIQGVEISAKAVKAEIEKYILNLKIFTIYLLTHDYKNIKHNIRQLKNSLDPADVRLRKRDNKSDKEVKNSFYYISNNNMDLLIIGTEKEITTGEKIIREFLLRENILINNYSYCFLCPTNYYKHILQFKKDHFADITKNDINIRIYEPNFIRKHLNVYFEGKWKVLMEIKTKLFEFLQTKREYKDYKDYRNNKKYDLNEFSQYAYNQEMKMISKNLRKSFIENNYSIKSWDFLSNELYNETEDSNYDKNQFVQKFIKTIERDTMLNFLTNLPPLSYSTIFGRTQDDLISYLIDYVEEANDSYNDHLSSLKKERGKERGREEKSKDREKEKDITNPKDEYRLSKHDNDIEMQSLSNKDTIVQTSKEKSIEVKDYNNSKIKIKDFEDEISPQRNYSQSKLQQSIDGQNFDKNLPTIEEAHPFLENFLVKENENINAMIEENSQLNYFVMSYLPNLTKNENYLNLPDMVKTAIIKAIKKSFENGILTKSQLENLTIDLKKTSNRKDDKGDENMVQEDNIEINMNFGDNTQASQPTLDLVNLEVIKQNNRDYQDVQYIEDRQHINKQKGISNDHDMQRNIFIQEISNLSPPPLDYEFQDHLKDNNKIRSIPSNESMNVSYNFNKINQMNISINIGKSERSNKELLSKKQYSNAASSSYDYGYCSKNNNINVDGQYQDYYKIGITKERDNLLQNKRKSNNLVNEISCHANNKKPCYSDTYSNNYDYNDYSNSPQKSYIFKQDIKEKDQKKDQIKERERERVRDRDRFRDHQRDRERILNKERDTINDRIRRDYNWGKQLERDNDNMPESSDRDINYRKEGRGRLEYHDDRRESHYNSYSLKYYDKKGKDYNKHTEYQNKSSISYNKRREKGGDHKDYFKKSDSNDYNNQSNSSYSLSSISSKNASLSMSQSRSKSISNSKSNRSYSNHRERKERPIKNMYYNKIYTNKYKNYDYTSDKHDKPSLSTNYNNYTSKDYNYNRDKYRGNSRIKLSKQIHPSQSYNKNEKVDDQSSYSSYSNQDNNNEKSSNYDSQKQYYHTQQSYTSSKQVQPKYKKYYDYNSKQRTIYREKPYYIDRRHEKSHSNDYKCSSSGMKYDSEISVTKQDSLPKYDNSMSMTGKYEPVSKFDNVSKSERSPSKYETIGSKYESIGKNERSPSKHDLSSVISESKYDNSHSSPKNEVNSTSKYEGHSKYDNQTEGNYYSKYGKFKDEKLDNYKTQVNDYQTSKKYKSNEYDKFDYKGAFNKNFYDDKSNFVDNNKPTFNNTQGYNSNFNVKNNSTTYTKSHFPNSYHTYHSNYNSHYNKHKNSHYYIHNYYYRQPNQFSNNTYKHPNNSKDPYQDSNFYNNEKGLIRSVQSLHNINTNEKDVRNESLKSNNSEENITNVPTPISNLPPNEHKESRRRGKSNSLSKEKNTNSGN